MIKGGDSIFARYLNLLNLKHARIWIVDRLSLPNKNRLAINKIQVLIKGYFYPLVYCLCKRGDEERIIIFCLRKQ